MGLVSLFFSLLCSIFKVCWGPKIDSNTFVRKNKVTMNCQYPITKIILPPYPPMTAVSWWELSLSEAALPAG